MQLTKEGHQRRRVWLWIWLPVGAGEERLGALCRFTRSSSHVPELLCTPYWAGMCVEESIGVLVEAQHPTGAPSARLQAIQKVGKQTWALT